MIDVKLNLEEGVKEPEYATEGAAGFDIRAKIEVNMNPGEKRVIPTGMYMEIPVGFELQIRPRSGTSLKTHLRIPNAPGTVDSDYRGEIGVIMENTGNFPVTISKGERIAQGVFAAVERANWINTDTLSATERGTGGFGSTGTK